MAELRSSLFTDTLPHKCQKCADTENSGNTSMRQYSLSDAVTVDYATRYLTNFNLDLAICAIWLVGVAMEVKVQESQLILINCHRQIKKRFLY